MTNAKKGQTNKKFISPKAPVASKDESTVDEPVQQEGQKSEDGDNTIGRGNTVPVQHYDETASISVPDEPAQQAPTPEPVTPEPAAALDTSPPESAKVDTQAPLGRQYLIQTLNTYIKNMRPGLGQSEEQGAREQSALANVLINNVFSASVDEFGGNMKVLLDTVKDNRKGAFNERYAYRYVGSMKLSNERRVLFEDLLTLTLTTSDHGASGASKQIDVRKLINRLADDRMVENLQTYYKIS